jgi:ArsR family metal-binding transcriptional regulator
MNQVAAMTDDLLITTFPALMEFEKVVAILKTTGAAYEVIKPNPSLALVALPALVVSREVRGALEVLAPNIVFSGWVDYRAATAEMPAGSEPEECDICFQRAAIMVLGPCVADETKIRIIAHLEGDLGPILPYLNAIMPQASFTPVAETLTLMDGHRMIALYRQRITIAKADEIVDSWLTLERIRHLALQAWNNRNQIKPCYETRKRPPAIEIFKRLPGTNCGLCGEPTCLAFAVRVWSGETTFYRCGPVFDEGGSRSMLREPLREIAAGMGLTDITNSQA